MPCDVSRVLRHKDHTNYRLTVTLRDATANLLAAHAALFFLATTPPTEYSGSSEIFGAFLAGLCFSGEHAAHAAWHKQVTRWRGMHWRRRCAF